MIGKKSNMPKGVERMFKAAVIDDNALQRESVKKQLYQALSDSAHSIHTYESPAQFEVYEDAPQMLDLLILDIEYKNEPDRNGIQFAEQFQKKYPHVDIIFMSSYLQFAPKVYDVEHISYIYKGEMSPYFEEAIAKAIEHKKVRNDSYLRLRWKNTFYLVPAHEIVFVEKVLRKTTVHTIREEISTYTKLEDILEILGDGFMRVHFSYIVNKNFIREVHSDGLYLTDGHYVPISRTYSKNVMDYMKNYYDYNKSKSE
jgi:DNA-binding LytR/AlgR family response regulator